MNILQNLVFKYTPGVRVHVEDSENFYSVVDPGFQFDLEKVYATSTDIYEDPGIVIRKNPKEVFGSPEGLYVLEF